VLPSWAFSILGRAGYGNNGYLKGMPMTVGVRGLAGVAKLGRRAPKSSARLPQRWPRRPGSHGGITEHHEAGLSFSSPGFAGPFVGGVQSQ
jgi:hypothetical protein